MKQKYIFLLKRLLYYIYGEKFFKRLDYNWKTLPNVERDDWDNDYYKNITEEDIRAVIHVDDIFSSYEFEVEENHCDLYFWGIKK